MDWIPIGRVTKSLLFFNILISFFYLSWWFIPGNMGNPYVYSLLLFGEIYHLIMALTFWFTIWPRKEKRQKHTLSHTPSVDIFIPVAGEPLTVIKRTVQAAQQMTYPNFHVFILNDGLVAKKDNWKKVENLAHELGVSCITREIPGGAKAGNINHALTRTTGEIIVIFDADMAPLPQFLQTLIPYFADSTIGFVQSPQFYENAHQNTITGGAWEQQSFFFGPIMAGKNTSNAAFICGTNVAIRRTALQEVGGMNEKNIAEDFLTSISIHAKGWKSFYIPHVLATGLAPLDLLSYFQQQLRWARGSLEVLFCTNILLKKGLTLQQKIHYLASALYYFNGVVVVIDMIAPLLFLLFDIQPVAATTTSFALFFIPFMISNLLTLYIASRHSFTFRAISFSQSSWSIQLVALFSLLLRKRIEFQVTSKQKVSGNFHHLVYPHLVYTAFALSATMVALLREGPTPAVITNVAWAFFNVGMFFPFIKSAFSLKEVPLTTFSLSSVK